MATKRKDTLVGCGEWCKHLRPFGKRLQAKAERRASRWEITAEMVGLDEPTKRLGLHNDPKAMARLKVEKGSSVVPRGMYCYGEKGNCPYWDKADNAPEQGNGFCWLTGKGDWNGDGGLLWDQCKECSVNDDGFCPDGCLETMGGDKR